jgi:transcriptional regulator GlxA family with amidase domain
VSALMREMLREAMRWPLHAPESAVASRYFAAMAALCPEWIAQETELLLPASEEPRLKRALDYTADRPLAALTAVCHHAGLSERSLRRRLKADIGMSWEAYRGRSRLLHAISLLGETQLAVGEVAARCGFESPSAFTRAFRQAMGEAPRDYRRRLRTGS